MKNLDIINIGAYVIRLKNNLDIINIGFSISDKIDIKIRYRMNIPIKNIDKYVSNTIADYFHNYYRLVNVVSTTIIEFEIRSATAQQVISPKKSNSFKKLFT